VIALYTFRPSFCAGCGRPIAMNVYNRHDFDARASFSCPGCGLDYQRIDVDLALDTAAAAGGDLARQRLVRG